MAASADVVPRVGVGVFIMNSSNDFVFGRRKGSHGAGSWALPGGHLEHGEDFETASKREILEETGLEITDVKFLTATNSVGIDGIKHYITIFMTARLVDGSAEPQLLEPNKCEGWEWISWEKMVQWHVEKGENGNHLFQPMSDLLRQRPEVRLTG